MSCNNTLHWSFVHVVPLCLCLCTIKKHLLSVLNKVISAAVCGSLKCISFDCNTANVCLILNRFHFWPQNQCEPISVTTHKEDFTHFSQPGAHVIVKHTHTLIQQCVNNVPRFTETLYLKKLKKQQVIKHLASGTETLNTVLSVLHHPIVYFLSVCSK